MLPVTGVLTNIIPGDTGRHRAGSSRARLSSRPTLNLRLSSSCALSKIADFLRGVDLEHNIENLFGRRLSPTGLVNLVGLVLGQDVSQVVYPLFIECLKRLEDEWRLGFPLLSRGLESSSRLINLLSASLPALFVQFVRLFSRILQFSGHGLEI